MTVKLGTNIYSLRAQRNLAEVSSKLSTTYERLSSGLRINSAADDAAGLSFAESLKTDRKIFSQGIRNFNDGISLLNIAESSVQQLSGIVTRIKELAEQASNGTFSFTQRAALDDEAQALSKEYTRIAQSTTFNGISLFTGNLQGLRLQGGSGVDGGIFQRLGGAIGDGTFSGISTIVGLSYNTAASSDFNGDGIEDLVAVSGTSIAVKLGNGDGTFQSNITYGTSAVGLGELAAGDFNGDGKIDIIANDSGSTRMYLFAGNGNGTFAAGTSSVISATGASDSGVADFNEDGYADVIFTGGGLTSYPRIAYGSAEGTFTTVQSVTLGPGGGVTANNLTIGDFNGDGHSDIGTSNSNGTVSVVFGTGTGSFSTYISLAAIANSDIASADFNNDGRDDLIVVGAGLYTFLGNADGTFQSSSAVSDPLTSTRVVSGDFNGDGLADIMHSGGAVSNVRLGTGSGTFNLAFSSAQATGYMVADFNNDGVLDVTGNTGIYIGTSKDGIGALLPFSLSSIASARQALTATTTKANQLSDVIGKIGAFQSRVETGTRVLDSMQSNYIIAESRIRDADIAEESSKLVSLQILQKSAASVLAQANLQPDLALKLLSGS